jgi:carbon monoxide dehydrogenase subunit G
MEAIAARMRRGHRRSRATPRVLALCGLLVAASASAGPPPAGSEDALRTLDVAGSLEAPFEAVRAVLLDLESFQRWFPAIGAWRVLGRDEEAVRIYGRQSLPWPVQDRDYVVDYRWWEQDGAFLLEATAVPDAEPPAPDGVVRVEVMRTEWRIEPDGERTRARYRYQGEMSGLARWLPKIGLRARSRAVLDGLSEELARRAAGP